MGHRINLKINENLKKDIDYLMKKNESNLSDTARELLEIGVMVKKKQLENEAQKVDAWEEYFKQIAISNDINLRLTTEILKELKTINHADSIIKKSENEAKLNNQNILNSAP
jgi:hypothetical protein